MNNKVCFVVYNTSGPYCFEVKLLTQIKASQGEYTHFAK